MLNPPVFPWVDPRTTDWTDGLNPLTKPGWSKNNNLYAYESLQDPVFVALRNAIGIEPRIWVCPDAAHQTIPPQGQSAFNVPAEPNTWLWALNAVSNPGQEADAAGFQVQIVDSFTGAAVFSAPVPNTLLDGTLTTSGDAKQSPLVLLAAPRLFVPPAYPIVTVLNLSMSSQVCIVQLFCCIETDVVTA
jgi:hypothetical protein